MGILVLGVLAVVLALTFGGAWSGPGPSSQAFQSPTVPSYPSPGTPLPPTIPSKPLVSPVLQATATAPPYPPPPAGTPPSVPTAVPPAATATPVPRVTVVPGPLPVGLKVIYVDKGKDDWTAVMWMANVDDLAHVRIVTELTTLGSCLWPGGQLSPNGRWIAYILPRKDHFSSVLGIVNIDGTGNIVLDDPVAGPSVEWSLRWSLDSQWIAYMHHIPYGDNGTKTEIWAIHPDGTEKRLLASEPTDVLLIGWSKDSRQVYYTPGGRDLWTVNVDGKSLPSVALRFDELTAPRRLSPDGRKIVYETYGGNDKSALVTLGVTSLDSREKYTLAKGIDGRIFILASYAPSAVWSPDSTRVVYNMPVDGTHIDLLNASWSASSVTTIRERDAAYYYPLSWSPDGKYIAAWRHLGDAIPGLGLHPVLIGLEGSVQRVYSIASDFSYCQFVGWLIGE